MTIETRIVPITTNESRDVAICNWCTGEVMFERHAKLILEYPEWIALNFYDPKAQTYIAAHFCSFECLMHWGRERNS